jgi:hypothetical protein
MSVRSQRSFDPEVDDADEADEGDLTEKSYDPEAGASNRNSSFSERSFDPECSMLDDENASYDASEASFDPDADRRSSMRSEKSFDPERADGGEQDLTGFEEGSHSVPKTISAAIAERAITSIRNVASQELERLRSEVESLRAALDASDRRYSGSKHSTPQ